MRNFETSKKKLKKLTVGLNLGGDFPETHLLKISHSETLVVHIQKLRNKNITCEKGVTCWKGNCELIAEGHPNTNSMTWD